MKFLERLRSHDATRRDDAITKYRDLANLAAVNDDLPDDDARQLLEVAHQTGRDESQIEKDLEAMRRHNDLQVMVAKLPELLAANKLANLAANEFTAKRARVMSELDAEGEAITTRQGNAGNALREAGRAQMELLDLARKFPELFPKQSTESEDPNV